MPPRLLQTSRQDHRNRLQSRILDSPEQMQQSVPGKRFEEAISIRLCQNTPTCAPVLGRALSNPRRNLRLLWIVCRAATPYQAGQTMKKSMRLFSSSARGAHEKLVVAASIPYSQQRLHSRMKTQLHRSLDTFRRSAAVMRECSSAPPNGLGELKGVFARLNFRTRGTCECGWQPPSAPILAG